MSTKTEQVTIPIPTELKSSLEEEAHTLGTSWDDALIRHAWNSLTSLKDEQELQSLVEQVRAATLKANASLDAGLAEAEQTVDQLRKLKNVRS